MNRRVPTLIIDDATKLPPRLRSGSGKAMPFFTWLLIVLSLCTRAYAPSPTLGAIEAAETALDRSLGLLVGYPFGYSYYQTWPFALRKSELNLFGTNPLQNVRIHPPSLLGFIAVEASSIIDHIPSFFNIPARGAAVRD